MANHFTVEVATRHQVFLERLKSQKANEYRPYLTQMDRRLRSILSALPPSPNRSRIESAIRDLQTVNRSLLADYVDGLLADALDLADSEADFERKLMENVSEAITVTASTNATALVKELPLSVRGLGGGNLLEPFLRDWAESEVQTVNGLIRRGWSEGQTINQIITDIRGTAGQRFTNGYWERSNRNARAVVRTAVQHISSAARQSTWDANRDIVAAIEWVSTLDSRTTSQCRALDGQRFDIDEGPRPPIHVGCRSTTVPVLKGEENEPDQGDRAALGGPVSANETYYTWLQKQPEGFQDEAIGPERAKLLRGGGLSAERFRELQLDSNFEPITLQRMRELEPLAFERAGI